MRSEPDLAVSFGWIPVLFVESQTQLLSSAKSLRCVECERDSAFPLSLEVVHKSRVGSANPESPCVVHIVPVLTQHCLLSHTVVAATQ